MDSQDQIPYNLKDEFIKKRRRGQIRENLGYRDKSLPTDTSEEIEPPNNSPPILDPRQEEDFKIVRDMLKINQSAITPSKEDVANQKLDDLAEKSDTNLLKINTFWPFTFFVHNVIIDPYKVTIVFRNFFWSEHIHSVMIRDILDVVVETSILFATLIIVDQGYTESSISVGYLKKKEAMEARKIIQGLVIAHRQGVDLSTLKTSDVKSKAEDIGKVKEIDSPNEIE